MPGKGSLDPRKVGVLTWDTPEKLRPTMDNVLLRIVPRAPTQGGIIIPVSARNEDAIWEAEVVAVGPGRCSNEDGRRIQMTVAVGQRVLVRRDPGWELGEFRMLGEGAVEGIIE